MDPSHDSAGVLAEDVNRYTDYTEELAHSLMMASLPMASVMLLLITHSRSRLGSSPICWVSIPRWLTLSWAGSTTFSARACLIMRSEWRPHDALLDFLAVEVQQRVQDPQDDLLTELLHMEPIDENAEVTPEVVIGIANLLVIAGIDTTWSSIGSALWHLGTNPDDLARLNAEPDLLHTAVEEFLRYYAPVTMARIADVDVSYGGVRIQQGDKVLMNFPAACHDPEHFENPDEFIIDRQRNRHVAFGSGIHRCAGSNLARLEMNVALRVWLERIPEFHVSDPDSMKWAGGQVRGPRIMQVSFPPGRPALSCDQLPHEVDRLEP